MKASKEEARRTIAEAERLQRQQVEENYCDGSSMKPIIDFLKLCEKRLPTEEALERDAAKQRKPKKDDVVVL